MGHEQLLLLLQPAAGSLVFIAAATAAAGRGEANAAIATALLCPGKLPWWKFPAGEEKDVRATAAVQQEHDPRSRAPHAPHSMGTIYTSKKKCGPHTEEQDGTRPRADIRECSTAVPATEISASGYCGRLPLSRGQER